MMEQLGKQSDQLLNVQLPDLIQARCSDSDEATLHRVESVQLGQDGSVEWKASCVQCELRSSIPDANRTIGVSSPDWYRPSLRVNWTKHCGNCGFETRVVLFYPRLQGGVVMPNALSVICQGCGRAFKLRPQVIPPEPVAAPPPWVETSPMHPEMLAEAVRTVITSAMDRVGPESVGAQQYWQPGNPQLFETMPLTELSRFYREELLDLITYAVMTTIRLDRLGSALQAKLDREVSAQPLGATRIGATVVVACPQCAGKGGDAACVCGGDGAFVCPDKQATLSAAEINTLFQQRFRDTLRVIEER